MKKYKIKYEWSYPYLAWEKGYAISKVKIKAKSRKKARKKAIIKLKNIYGDCCGFEGILKVKRIK